MLLELDFNEFDHDEYVDGDDAQRGA